MCHKNYPFKSFLKLSLGHIRKILSSSGQCNLVCSNQINYNWVACVKFQKSTLFDAFRGFQHAATLLFNLPDFNKLNCAGLDNTYLMHSNDNFKSFWRHYFHVHSHFYHKLCQISPDQPDTNFILIRMKIRFWM